MPYTIKDTGNPGPHRYAIVKKATGSVVAHAASQRDADIYVGNAEGADTHSEEPRPQLGTITGCELFDVGEHKGKFYDTNYIDSLVHNFQRLSAGDKPLLTTPLILGHEEPEDQQLLNSTGLPAAGRLANVYRVGTKLVGDFVDIPEIVGKLIAQKAYRKVSAEINDDFQDQGVHYGPTLRRIALLGGEIPQVKSLDDVPLAKFFEFSVVTTIARSRDGKQTIRRDVRGKNGSKPHNLYTEISETTKMDRAQMLAALQQIGFNTSILTDAVPDEVIAELLAALQAGSNQATPGSTDITPADQNPPPANSQMSDGAPLNPPAAPPANQQTPAPMFSQGDPGSTTPGPANPTSGIADGSPGASTVPTAFPSSPTQHPSQVIMKYSEDISRIVSEQVRGVMKPLEQRLRTAEQQAAQRLANEKRANIDAFCERMVKDGKILPAELDRGDPKNPRPTLKDVMLAADANAVMKFGEKSVSQLELLMRTIEGRPRISRFSELVKDPAALPAGRIDEERRKQLLNSTVIGRAAAVKNAKK